MEEKNLLVEFRRDFKLSQKALGELLGTHQGSVSNWERGIRKIPRIVINFLDCYRNLNGRSEAPTEL